MNVSPYLILIILCASMNPFIYSKTMSVGLSPYENFVANSIWYGIVSLIISYLIIKKFNTSFTDVFKKSISSSIGRLAFAGITFTGILTVCDGDVFTGLNPSFLSVGEVKK